MYVSKVVRPSLNVRKIAPIAKSQKRPSHNMRSQPATAATKEGVPMKRSTKALAVVAPAFTLACWFWIESVQSDKFEMRPAASIAGAPESVTGRMRPLPDGEIHFAPGTWHPLAPSEERIEAVMIPIATTDDFDDQSAPASDGRATLDGG